MPHLLPISRPVRARLALLLLSAVTLAAARPAAAQQGWDQGATPSPSPDKKALPNDPYSRAMVLKQRGDYEKALPLLKSVAGLGIGYEVAKLELGKCYYELARKETTAEGAVRQRTLGFASILAAANGGFHLAQQELVRIYLDGDGVPVDPPEAGRWYLLWKNNPSRMQIGAIQFDVVLEQRLKATLTPAEWQDAQNRANHSLVL
jgi:hypothetical protein